MVGRISAGNPEIIGEVRTEPFQLRRRACKPLYKHTVATAVPLLGSSLV